MQIIILGMHRSGTSAVTGLLHMLGAYVGPLELMDGATGDNPRGLWERRDVQAVNDAVLISAGAAWHRLISFRPDQLPESILEAFETEAMETIRQLDTHRPWAIKDPRFCLLLPLWRRFLDDPVCVLPCRHPVEVALSIKARDHLPLPVGVALWEKYTLEALQATRGFRRVIVFHQAMMTDPIAFTRQLHAGLVHHGLTRLQLPADSEIRKFIQDSLYHSRMSAGLESLLLNTEQRRLWEALGQAANGEEIHVPPLSRGADFVLREHEDQDRHLSWFRHRIRELEARLQQDRVLIQRRLESLQTAAEAHFASLSWRMVRRGCRTVQTLLGRPPEQTAADSLATSLARLRGAVEPTPSRSGDSSALPAGRRTGRSRLRAIALLASHNEERFIQPCLEHLVEQGFEVILLDDASTDRTVPLAESFLGGGLLEIRRRSREKHFQWESILKWKEELADQTEADWFLHADPDEFRLPPRPGQTLAEALAEVDAAGFNAVNFLEYTFVPTRESPDHDHPNFQQTMRHYYPFLRNFPHRLTAWKKQPRAVDLAWSGGHVVRFPELKMYPLSFPMKHYLFLSPAHAIRKYADRSYDPAEVDRGWHGWRSHIRPEDIVLPTERELRPYISDKQLDPSHPRMTHILEDLVLKQAPSQAR